MNIAHVLTVAFTLTLGSAGCFSVGSPAYSCRKKVPGHVNDATEGPAPYSITVTRTVIQPGQATRVTLESTSEAPFRGFLCAASEAQNLSNDSVGVMSLLPSSAFSSRDTIQLLTCLKSTPDTAVTHVSKSDKFKVEFAWTPPANAVVGQQYRLRCTVVKTFFQCWTDLQASITIGTSPP